MSVVVAKDIRKSFGPLEVLKGVSLTVEAGEAISLVPGSSAEAPGPGAVSLAWTGMTISTRVPTPSRDSMRNSPPRAATSRFTKAKPRPAPAMERS